MADRVRDACEACFDANQGDCSAFVRAVGDRLGIPIAGQANDIVDSIRGGGVWQAVADGIAAEAAAERGDLVIAGLRGDEQFNPSNHGHVAVIVSGNLAHGRYPSGYWGKLGGTGGRDETINWSWNEHDRDRLSYAAQPLPPE